MSRGIYCVTQVGDSMDRGAIDGDDDIVDCQTRFVRDARSWRGQNQNARLFGQAVGGSIP